MHALAGVWRLQLWWTLAAKHAHWRPNMGLPVARFARLPCPLRPPARKYLASTVCIRPLSVCALPLQIPAATEAQQTG